ncbi:hypothetical protein U1Q18_017019 [Sarracenia purpurea var. burkii]
MSSMRGVCHSWVSSFCSTLAGHWRGLASELGWIYAVMGVVAPGLGRKSGGVRMLPRDLGRCGRLVIALVRSGWCGLSRNADGSSS